MNVNQMYPSKWLKAADLGKSEYEVTIHSVQLEDVGTDQAPDQKPVLYFVEGKKGMVLNKTNAETIAYLYGPETDAWIGKKITLFPVMVDFKGTPTPAIRLRGNVQPQPGTNGPFAQAGQANSPAGAQAPLNVAQGDQHPLHAEVASDDIPW